jgi:hypothetical protein
MMHRGNLYVKLLGLDSPMNSTSCETFNRDAFYQEVENYTDNKPEKKARYSAIHQSFAYTRLPWEENGTKNHLTAYHILFPRPDSQEGIEYGKGALYVIAALYCSGLSVEECNERVQERLLKPVRDAVRRAKDRVLRFPDVVEKRRLVAKAWGVGLRDV